MSDHDPFAFDPFAFDPFEPDLRPVCCFMTRHRACHAHAEWLIVDGPMSDNQTYACTLHVGHLLQDDRESNVSPIRRDGMTIIGNVATRSTAGTDGDAP